MKTLSPIILFAVALHYVFVAAMSTKISGLRETFLIGVVIIAAVFTFGIMASTKD